MFDDGFEEFWEQWPGMRVKKMAARKEWHRIKPSPAMVTRMIETLAWQRLTPECVKDGAQFFPRPDTWLRNKRWEDEPFHAPQVSEKTARTMQAIYGTSR